LSEIFFTEEERLFREQVKTFTKEHVAPIGDKIEADLLHPKELIAEMGRRGYLGLLHPPEYGGSGKGVSFEIIVAEELSAVSAAAEMSRLASASLYAMPINRFGTGDQKQKYLAPIVKGEKIGALCITEPTVGSDTAGMKTTATRKGEGYLLNGEKRFITNGSVADFLVVFAITDASVHPHKGMSAFIAETSTPGFEVLKDHDLLGMRGARVAHLSFREMKVPAENLLGKENEGFRVLMDELDSERVVVAAGMIGTARSAYETAVKYSTERVQFDQPIRKFEGVSFKIADMALKLEASRLLVLQAARMIDRGMRATKQAAMAKLYSTETAVEISNEALQTLGGIGYTKEYRVERYLRDTRLMTIGAGTSEIMRYLIQREVYREFGY